MQINQWQLRTRMCRRLPSMDDCCRNSCCWLRNDCTDDNVAVDAMELVESDKLV